MTYLVASKFWKKYLVSNPDLHRNVVATLEVSNQNIWGLIKNLGGSMVGKKNTE